MDTLPPHAQNDKPSIPAIPGVYKITCVTNNRIYIGSSVNLRKRQRDHFSDLRKNKHRNPYLQRAWNKYGEQAFIFEVVELVLIPELLTAQEQYWLNKLKPFGKRGFNIARDAEAPRLGLKHTPEARVKMGMPNIGNKYNLGRKATPETIERLRQSHTGKPSTFKGKHHTPEAREKLRQARSRQQITREAIEKARQSNTGKKRAFKPNTYRIEGDVAYITLTRDQETVIDSADLGHVLKIRWNAAYNQRTKGYHARGTLEGKPVFLSRYIMGAKEDERIDHLNYNTLDNRRSNLQVAQPTDTYHRKTSPASKLGIRGVDIYKHKSGNLAYQFRCRGCKVSKNFPYTEKGLEDARAFSEAHYASMKGEQ